MADATANLFLVGVPRAGTTSLAAALDQHADIFVCPLKEPHYYAYDTTSFAGPGDDWLARNWCSNSGAYAKQFAEAPAGIRYLVDASTNYFHDATALRRIVAAVPDAKFIVVVRNPVDRARSAHRFLQWQGHETLPLTEALAVERERADAGWSQIWRYAADSHYADSMEAFFAIVPPNQRCVVLFDDFHDWADLRSRVLEFLALSPQRLALPHMNAKGAPPNALVAKLLNRPSDLRARIGGSALGRILAPLLGWARTATSRRAQAMPIESLPKVVDESWAADGERLSRLIGRDLRSWVGE